MAGEFTHPVPKTETKIRSGIQTNYVYNYERPVGWRTHRNKECVILWRRRKDTQRCYESEIFLVFVVFAPGAIILDFSAIAHGNPFWKIALLSLFTLFALIMFLGSVGYREVKCDRQTQQVQITERSFLLSYCAVWTLPHNRIAKVALVYQETPSFRGGRYTNHLEILLRDAKKSIPIRMALLPWTVKKAGRQVAHLLGVDFEIGVVRRFGEDWSLEPDRVSWFWGLMQRRRSARH